MGISALPFDGVEPLGQGIAVHLGHGDVDERHVEALAGLDPAQRLAWPAGLPRGHAPAGDLGDHDLAVGGVVVDDHGPPADQLGQRPAARLRQVGVGGLGDVDRQPEGAALAVDARALGHDACRPSARPGGG